MSTRPFLWRSRTIVDRRVQWRFAVALFGMQLVAILAFVAALQLRLRRLIDASESLAVEVALRDAFGQGLMTLLAVGPIIALFTVLFGLRLSNHFVGPVPRLRKALRAMAAGETGVQLRFRPGDALAGVDDDVNLLARALDRRVESGEIAAVVRSVVEEVENPAPDPEMAPLRVQG